MEFNLILSNKINDPSQKITHRSIAGLLLIKGEIFDNDF
ncbi:hypothetical protein ADICYQ_5172 [Cyclobacterium qasimii M12-11B]|uniref:Uncharacterized protein n=1 Tax=Cyclobacterium qasimii M12-11B TaxID=641524 RepID=S7WGD6_9BACT|nr:hypothetical protein ADICYQ_5172 [Cyclobacterium qasimii M12-11B]